MQAKVLPRQGQSFAGLREKMIDSFEKKTTLRCVKQSTSYKLVKNSTVHFHCPSAMVEANSQP